MNNYNYEFYYELSGPATVALLLILALVGLVAYIFRSMGLYGIAKHRELKNPWMAWIPVLFYRTLGSISDQYRYVTKGTVNNKRNWLLVLKISDLVVATAMLAAEIRMMVNMVNAAMAYASDTEMLSIMMSGLLIIMVMSLVRLGIGIALAVVYYIALYDLFVSCEPKNAVLFLVLSILFSLPEPFFIFFNRRKEAGMPPRRPQPMAYAPQQYGYQPMNYPPQQPMYPPQQPMYPPQQPMYPPQQPMYQPPVYPPQVQNPQNESPADTEGASVCLPQESVSAEGASAYLPQESAEPAAETWDVQ